MTTTFEEFDAAAVSLSRGINLIEAGAGTGKTYAIGMLVLRALVELGVDIDRILIVTFTKAATEELRGRIRSRLVEAKVVLTGGEQVGGSDPTLLRWMASLEDRAKAVARINLALLDYDQAAIFTIHGFCQRMLQEQALESGQLFETELLTDIDKMIREISDDYWRSKVYPLSAMLGNVISQQYGLPEKLLASVRPVLHRQAPIAPDPAEHEILAARLTGLANELRSWWQEHGEALQALIAAGIDAAHFNKGVDVELQELLAGMQHFGASNDSALPPHLELLLRENLYGKLNGNKFRGDKKQRYFESWPLPEKVVEELREAVRAYLLNMRRLFADYLRQELESRMSRQGTMGFNDLISRLARALTDTNGPLLCGQLGARYQVALIDEFQDTDQDQYTIFSRLFGDSNHWLYLIGDPKQAIYSFRGADIHSYFAAQQGAARQLTLTHNYRSHPALVAEVNRLFTAHNTPFGYNAGILQYHAVSAAKGAAVRLLERRGQTLGGMHYCVLERDVAVKDGRWFSGKAADWLLRFVVREIVSLLDGGTTITDEHGTRLLKAGDIAILVRSHFQAELCREILAGARIPAVLGSRQSVFATRECQELIMLLKAIENPGDIRLVKGAMTISWFGRSGDELVAIWQDEQLFGEWVGRFHQYRLLWNDRGFMTMFSQFFAFEQIAEALARNELAERRITNINHLAELVQEQETEQQLGTFQLLQWLGRMAAEPQSSENSELLLESDSDAVKIVTMHMAKGLQYHVVFCPYLWYWRDGGTSDCIAVHDGNGPVIDLGSSQFERRAGLALAEQRAEDTRLLYVALTRAMSCCYVFWADVKARATVGDARSSAFARLLFTQPDGTLEVDTAALAGLAETTPEIFHHVVATDDESLPLLARTAVTEMLAPQQLTASHYTDWQMSSFSAMVGLSEYEYDSGQLLAEVPASDADATPIVVLNLPAGAGFGNVIHDLLETLPFPALAGADRDDFLPEIRRTCRRYTIDSPAEDIGRLLTAVVSTPLLSHDTAVPQFALMDVPENTCLKEMPYYLRFNALETSEIGRLLHHDPAVAPLASRNMQGYLTGFIDLIFAVNGQFFLCDYKTNFLGDRRGDYHHEALVNAMQAHNYGLQYWLYTVVLNRYLRSRLPDYSYERDFGGVMYLFLRGMTPDAAGSGVYFTKPAYEIVLALDELLEGADGQS